MNVANINEQNNEISFFNQNGFVVIKNIIPNIKEAQREISEIVQSARRGDLKSADVFFHYPDSSGELNIGQINFPFEECGPLPELKKAFEGINFDNILNKYTGVNFQEFVTNVARLHVTSKKFKYMQPWHRDEPLGDSQLTINNSQIDSLRVNLYFFDESGFQLIPKRHSEMYENRQKEREIYISGVHHCQTDLKIAETIKVEAGDVLIFHPELLHRGYCSTERASFHLIMKKQNNFDEISFSPAVPANLRYTFNQNIEVNNLRLDGNLRKLSNLLKYYSPIPSLNFWKFLIEKPDYVINNFIQRPSIFQK